MCIEDLLKRPEGLFTATFNYYEMPESHHNRQRMDILPEKDGYRIIELPVSDLSDPNSTSFCRAI